MDLQDEVTLENCSWALNVKRYGWSHYFHLIKVVILLSLFMQGVLDVTLSVVCYLKKNSYCKVIIIFDYINIVTPIGFRNLLLENSLVLYKTKKATYDLSIFKTLWSKIVDRLSVDYQHLINVRYDSTTML